MFTYSKLNDNCKNNFFGLFSFINYFMTYFFSYLSPRSLPRHSRL